MTPGVDRQIQTPVIDQTDRWQPMMIPLQELFEDPPDVIRFDDEVEAVAIGKKGMAVLGWPRSSIQCDDGYDEDYCELVRVAMSRGLLIINHLRRSTSLDVDVFVVRHDQLWRVSAYIELKRAFEAHRWSNGAEQLECTLLGYSETATASWLALMKSLRVDWESATMYMLLTEQQCVLLRKAGMRSVPPEALSEGIIAFVTSSNKVIRRDVDSVLVDRVVARVAVKHEFVRSTLTEMNEDIVSTTLTNDVSESLNMSIDSRIELFSKGQWQ